MLYLISLSNDDDSFKSIAVKFRFRIEIIHQFRIWIEIIHQFRIRIEIIHQFRIRIEIIHQFRIWIEIIHQFRIRIEIIYQFRIRIEIIHFRHDCELNFCYIFFFLNLILLFFFISLHDHLIIAWSFNEKWYCVIYSSQSTVNFIRRKALSICFNYFH